MTSRGARFNTVQYWKVQYSVGDRPCKYSVTSRLFLSVVGHRHDSTLPINDEKLGMRLIFGAKLLHTLLMLEEKTYSASEFHHYLHGMWIEDKTLLLPV